MLGSSKWQTPFAGQAYLVPVPDIRRDLRYIGNTLNEARSPQQAVWLSSLPEKFVLAATFSDLRANRAPDHGTRFGSQLSGFQVSDHFL